MSKKEVESILGKASKEENWDNDNMWGTLKYPGLELEFFRIDNDEGTEIIGEELARIYIENNIFTSRGIKIGSPLEDVLNAYNKENISAYKEFKTPNEYFCDNYEIEKNDIEIIAVNKNGIISIYEAFSDAIQFEIKDGKVSSIKIWGGPE
jgi:hypothetical protein